MAHTEWLPGVQLSHSVPPVQYLERIVRVSGVGLLQLSSRALAAQAGGVLGLTPADCRPFNFPLF